MLVLTRRSGETIEIGNAVTIVVRRISRNRVSLAIDAADEVPIRRGELPDNPTVRNGRHGRADRNSQQDTGSVRVG